MVQACALHKRNRPRRAGRSLFGTVVACRRQRTQLPACSLHSGGSGILRLYVDEKITIKKIIGSKSIRFEKIENMALFPATGMRSMGMGSCGFLGYTGLRYSPQIGQYASFVGSYDQTILIETGGGMKYLISCEHPEELIKHYHTLISMP